MKKQSKSLFAVACASLLSVPGYAQKAPLSITNTDVTPNASATYWTAERFKAAKPLTLPMAAGGQIHGDAAAVQPDSRSVGAAAQPPSYRSNIAGQQLFAPGASAGNSTQANDAIAPQAYGSLGAHYTSTRVFPLFGGSSAPFSADQAYPHRTVGKLFFSINGSPYVCSAAVIQRRVVATAGHCVHSGGPNGFYSNWVFVPSFRDGAAPFKAWNWRFVTVTPTWAGGGGAVPNAADYAMIEFGDQAMVTGGPLTKIGNVTGWLGWQTLSLAANHTSKLGYPCNLDSCQKMQNVTSNAFRATAPNNVEYGSDATGGSSGGPWVQNFEQMAVGGGTGSNPAANRVVGITSYGYVSTSPKVQGASILDSRWVDLWNLICARAGNCA